MSKNHKYDDLVIQFVNQYWKDHYNSPSMREICQECGVPSTSHVSMILSRLQGRGLVTLSQVEGKWRGITPMWVAMAIEKAENGGGMERTNFPDYCKVEFCIAHPCECGCGAAVKVEDDGRG